MPSTIGLLSPLGFTQQTLPARGQGEPRLAFVLELPGSARGARAIVLGEGYSDAPEHAHKPVVLWLEDSGGASLHRPTVYRNALELEQQLRDGVWDNFWDSALSLRSNC